MTFRTRRPRGVDLPRKFKLPSTSIRTMLVACRCIVTSSAICGVRSLFRSTAVPTDICSQLEVVNVSRFTATMCEHVWEDAFINILAQSESQRLYFFNARNTVNI